MCRRGAHDFFNFITSKTTTIPNKHLEPIQARIHCAGDLNLPQRRIATTNYKRTPSDRPRTRQQHAIIDSGLAYRETQRDALWNSSCVCCVILIVLTNSSQKKQYSMAKSKSKKATPSRRDNEKQMPTQLPKHTPGCTDADPPMYVCGASCCETPASLAVSFPRCRHW